MRNLVAEIPFRISLNDLIRRYILESPSLSLMARLSFLRIHLLNDCIYKYPVGSMLSIDWVSPGESAIRLKDACGETMTWYVTPGRGTMTVMRMFTSGRNLVLEVGDNDPTLIGDEVLDYPGILR